VFDSLGIFYSVISSTQGGWTWLSSEGRYMGATAYGNGDRKDRKTNPYYAALKPILALEPDGTNSGKVKIHPSEMHSKTPPSFPGGLLLRRYS
jgi:hypothetical protein